MMMKLHRWWLFLTCDSLWETRVAAFPAICVSNHRREAPDYGSNSLCRKGRLRTRVCDSPLACWLLPESRMARGTHRERAVNGARSCCSPPLPCQGKATCFQFYPTMGPGRAALLERWGGDSESGCWQLARWSPLLCLGLHLPGGPS